MRRREVVALLGGSIGLSILSLVSGGLVARAQSGKIPRIGIIVLGNPDPAPFLKAFREGLALRGRREGENIVLEIRSAAGDVNRLAQAAVELVRLPVDIIVAWQTPAVAAARDATKDIPIVMAGAGDPVGTDLVASLSRPGGNITGLGGSTAELAAKNLELLREILPKARRVGVLVNGTDPFGKPFREQLVNAAETSGVALEVRVLERPDELEAAFAALADERAEAVIVQPSLPHRRSVNLALKYKLPAISPNRGFAEMGGLFAYNANAAAMHRESATYVDRILKGERPADLPVQGPTVFELVINLKAAKAIGITIPPALLARADEVIE